MPVADDVVELLQPVIETLGVELIDVEWVGSSLRVVIDQDGGITTDRLTEVNRLISPILDQHDPVPGRYTLEVSSPGVERKLTRPLHYTRSIGEDIVVKLEPGNEPRRIKGRLVAFDADANELTIDAVELDGVDLASPETHKIALGDIAKSRTVFVWGPTPKRGGKSAGKKKAAAQKTTLEKSAAGNATSQKPADQKPSGQKKRKVKQHPELDEPPISTSTIQSSKQSEAPRHE